MIRRIEQVVRSWLERLHTHAVGKVVHWNGAAHRARVKPKFQKRLGDQEEGDLVRKPPQPEEQKSKKEKAAETKDTGEGGEGIGNRRTFPGTKQPFTARTLDTRQDLDGPETPEVPDLIWMNSNFGQHFPWDDDVPVMLGYSMRDHDEAIKDMGSRPPKTSRMMHPKDAFIMGALVPDNASEPDWGSDMVLAYHRTLTNKHLRFTPDAVWYMTGTKIVILSNDGEVTVKNDNTGHNIHIDQDGNISEYGQSRSVSTDDGDMAVNNRNLLAELDDLDARLSALE